MKNKTKFIIGELIDIIGTFIAPALIIIRDFCETTNSGGYKIALGGIVLFLVLLFVGKSVFEKGYQDKVDKLIESIAMETDMEKKLKIQAKLNSHRTVNYIYQRVMLLLPFIVLFLAITFAQSYLTEMLGTVSFITISLAGGSIGNIYKKTIK